MCAGEGQIGEQRQEAHQADMSQLVPSGNGFQERPPLITFAAVGNADDREKNEDEADGKSWQEPTKKAAGAHRRTEARFGHVPRSLGKHECSITTESKRKQANGFID